MQLRIGDHRSVILFGWVAALVLSGFFSGEWNAWFMVVFFILLFLTMFFILRQPSTPALLGTLLPGLGILAALLAILLVSALRSGYLAAGLAQWFILVAYVCLVVVGASLRSLNPSGTWFVRPVVLVAAAVALWALVHELPHGGAIRLMSTLGNANALGGFLLIAFPMSIAQFLIASGRWKVLWASCFTIIVLAFVLTFSYTAWVALLVAVFFLVIITPNVSRGRIIGLIGVTAAIAILVAALAILPRYFSVVRTYSPVTSQHLSMSFSQRTQFNVVSIHMIRDAWLLGFGPGSYQSVFARYALNFSEQPKYAHNEYLQMFAEGGVFAGLLFLMFFGLTVQNIVRVLRQLNRNVLVLSIATAILASLVNAGVDFAWHFPAVSLPLWVGIGFLLAGEPGATQVRLKKISVRVAMITLLVLSLVLFARGLTLFLATSASDQAQLLQRRGDIPEAQDQWRRAALFDPQPATWRNIGWNAYGDRTQADWASQAQAAALSAYRWGRDDYFTAHLLGRIAYAQNQYPEAEAQLRRAITLDPLFHVNLQHDLAFVLRDEGRLDEAIEVLSATLEQSENIVFSGNPTHADGLAHVAVALAEFEQQRGDTAASRAAYERALTFVPDYAPALQGLGELVK